MSDLSKARIKRGPGPSGKMKDWNYRRRAWPYLERDFESRCAYSMRHILHSGKRCMEVDHFDPTLKPSLRNRYSNLMLATRLCNNFKQHAWPDFGLQQKGVRFLNPTKEQDYGVQIFEDSKTHELVGATPAARYHIDMLGLNDDSFIEERKDRAMLSKVEKGVAIFAGSFADIGDGLGGFRTMLDKMIPPIPPPPEQS